MIEQQTSAVKKRQAFTGSSEPSVMFSQLFAGLCLCNTSALKLVFGRVEILETRVLTIWLCKDEERKEVYMFQVERFLFPENNMSQDSQTQFEKLSSVGGFKGINLQGKLSEDALERISQLRPTTPDFPAKENGQKKKKCLEKTAGEK